MYFSLLHFCKMAICIWRKNSHLFSFFYYFSNQCKFLDMYEYFRICSPSLTLCLLQRQISFSKGSIQSFWSSKVIQFVSSFPWMVGVFFFQYLFNGFHIFCICYILHTCFNLFVFHVSLILPRKLHFNYKYPSYMHKSTPKGKELLLIQSCSWKDHLYMKVNLVYQNLLAWKSDC